MTSVVGVLSFTFPRLRDLVELSKPRILTMVLVTTVTGYFFGARGLNNLPLLLCTLAGTGLTVAGSCSLNNYLEREVDARMKRTNRRVLPTGRLPSHLALFYGVIAILLGVLLLVSLVNLLTGFLALLSAFLYVLVYTPLKRISWTNTLVGAIPGALPPMGGWVAATGELGVEAWILFFVLFAWQQPHFYAIAWMYREDYRRAGLKMLPTLEEDGRRTFREILVYSVLLIPLSLMPTFVGMSGMVYYVGMLFLGVYFLFSGIALIDSHSNSDARNLLKASVVYLPLWLILIVADAAF